LPARHLIDSRFEASCTESIASYDVTGNIYQTLDAEEEEEVDDDAGKKEQEGVQVGPGSIPRRGILRS
jgi:hypothetical protein